MMLPSSFDFPILVDIDNNQIYVCKDEDTSEHSPYPRTDLVAVDTTYRLHPSNRRIEVNGALVTEIRPLHHRDILVVDREHFLVFLKEKDNELRNFHDIYHLAVAKLHELAFTARTEGLGDSETGIQLTFPPKRCYRFDHHKNYVIGRESNADIQLSNPQVSRHHASIERSKETFLSDLASSNGTFINGERVYRKTKLSVGDRLDIGPYGFIFTGDSLFLNKGNDEVELVAEHLTRKVLAKGQSRTLLDDVSFTIRPKEFTCILGPSGSGKSVLLKTLSGAMEPDQGQVFLNRESLYANLELLKRRIATVNQRDVLHESLRLNRSMYYTAKLRLPDDMSSLDRATSIEKTLCSVGLSEHQNTLISNLSGGQKRRASLANELLSQPSLVFLDEVTSGLDDNTDQEMMQLFRELADSGKTIVCITHNINHVVEFCDRVLVIAPGGKLVFDGRPCEALQHFGVQELNQIYTKLNSLQATNKGSDRRLPGSSNFTLLRTFHRNRRARIADWLQSKYNGVNRYFRHFLLLTSRSVQIKVSNVYWLPLLLLQAVGLAILISWLFGDLSKVDFNAAEQAQIERLNEYKSQIDKAKNLAPLVGINNVDQFDIEKAKQSWLSQKIATLNLRLMLSTAMVALWFGCNNAIGEIVRERRLYESEREASLSPAAYLTSKVALWTFFSCLQIIVLFSTVAWLTNMGGDLLSQTLVLCLTSLVGISLGLAISAWTRSVEIATIAVPVALVPQILLAGTFVPLEGLKQTIAEWCISLHWSYRGMASQLPINNDVRTLLEITGSLNNVLFSDSMNSIAMLVFHSTVLILISYLGIGSSRTLKSMLTGRLGGLYSSLRKRHATSTLP